MICFKRVTSTASHLVHCHEIVVFFPFKIKIMIYCQLCKLLTHVTFYANIHPTWWMLAVISVQNITRSWMTTKYHYPAFAFTWIEWLMMTFYRSCFQETDFKEWKLVVQEISRFLKADTAFMNIRPLRYSLVLDLHPDSLPRAATRRSLKLRDAILSSYHHNEVRY